MKKTVFLLLFLCLFLCLNPVNAAEDEWLRLDWYSGGAMGIRFTDIVLEELEDENAILSLWPKETIRDMVVEELSLDGDTLVATVLYTAPVVESNDVLNLHATLYDVLPRFRVTYLSPAGTTECRYITASGEDGSLLLLRFEDTGLECLADADGE